MIGKKFILLSMLATSAMPCMAAAIEHNEIVQVADPRARYIDGERVKAVEQKIAYEFAWKQKAKLATTGIFCVACMAACIKIYNEFNIVSNTELREMRLLNMPVIKAMLESGAFKDDQAVQKAAKGFVDKVATGGSLQTLLQFVKSGATFLGQGIFSFGIGQMLHKIWNEVMHKQSIKWFLPERTLIPDIMLQTQVLKADIDNLKTGKTAVAKGDCDNYVETLLQMHNMIAEQVEALIGYMRYRISTVPETALTQVGNITTGMYLTNRVQFVADELNMQANVYKTTGTPDERIFIIGKMFEAVQQLMLNISSSVNQFGVIEKKMLED